MKGIFQILFTFCLLGFFGTCSAYASDGNHFSSSACEKIITDSTFLIKKVTEEKLYLDEERVLPTSFDSTSHELILDNGYCLEVKCLQKDPEGYYLCIPMDSLSKTAKEKLFKNVCLDCKHEWCGGAIVFRCPNCYSRNIRTNIPNW
jgi:hypothetical protein